MTEQLTTPETAAGGSVAPTADRRWIRVLAGAIVVYAVSHLAMMALTGELIPPVMVFALVGLGVAGLVTRRPRAGAWTAAAIGVVQLLTSIPFIVESAAHPESPVDFLHNAFVGIGVVVSIVAAVAILRRRATDPRRLVVGAAIVAGLFTIASAGATLAAGSDPVGGEDATLTAADIAWERDEIQVPTGGLLYVDNTDLARHTFTVPDGGVSVELPAGRARQVQIDLAPGTYEFVCDVPGHESMTGTLLVSGP